MSAVTFVRELRPLHLSAAPDSGRERDASVQEARGKDARSEEASESATPRLRGLIESHYDFVWRTLRNLGVDEASAEDATQQVLVILARRLGDIAPGAEMSFLFSTAARVASEVRRASRRHPVVPLADVAEKDIEELVALAPTVEELLDQRRAREVLRGVLGSMPDDLRAVFVLCELEEMGAPEVSRVLGVPVGTVSSRLRRARKAFQEIVRRLHAAQRRGRAGGPR